MAAKALNIEVCDQTISVCRTARHGKAVRISDAFVFPTPENCVSDGVILNAELLAVELRKQLTLHGVGRTKNVVFSLSSSRVAVREVKLPPMKKKLIASAVATNAEDYFPIDLKSYHITYTILEAASGAKPYNRLLVLAVPVSVIEGYFQFAEKASLTIKAIDSCGNSQYQAVKQFDFKGVSVFMDVDSASCIVSFIREGKLLLQRTFSFGADELLNHYMTLSGKTRADFVQVIHETDATHPDFAADKLLSLTDVQNDLQRLVGGVLRSIDYFNSSQSGIGVARIVLMGLNRHIVGLRELIADSTGIETLFLDNIPEFAQFTGSYPGAPDYVACIGCTLAPLNLIPKQYQPAKRLTAETDDSTIVPGIILCSIIVAGAILISASSWLNYVSALNDLLTVQNEIGNLQTAQQTYQSYVSFQDAENTVNALLVSTESKNADLVSFLAELEDKLPSSLLVTSISCTNEGVSMNLSVGSYTEAAALISALRSFESLERVEVSDLSRSANEAGQGRVSFSINCFYGYNPYLGNVNPYNNYFYDSDNTTDTTDTADSSAVPAQ